MVSRLRQAMLVAAMMVVAATATAELIRKWGRIGGMQVVLTSPDRFSDEVNSAFIVAPAAQLWAPSTSALKIAHETRHRPRRAVQAGAPMSRRRCFAAGRVVVARMSYREARLERIIARLYGNRGLTEAQRALFGPADETTLTVR